MEEKRERADCLSGEYAREAKRGECEASAGQAWKRGKGICRNASWRHRWDVVGGILAGLIGQQRGGTGREREGRMHVYPRRASTPLWPRHLSRTLETTSSFADKTDSPHRFAAMIISSFRATITNEILFEIKVKK